MRRLLNPMVLVLTAILTSGYAYLAWRLTSSGLGMALLLVPVALVWIVPVVYWSGEREGQSSIDHALHFASYLSMGWLSFVLVFSLARDFAGGVLALLGLDAARTFVEAQGGGLVVTLSLAALVVGAAVAARGPRVTRLDVPVTALPKDLDGFRIALISDLHVGPTIKRPYVERVVDLTLGENPDLIALTGDIVDGKFKDLQADATPLGKLAATGKAYYVPGNHEYYRDPREWMRYFRELGFHMLLNAHEIVQRGAARLLVGGVVDPAVRIIEPEGKPDLARAAGEGTAADFRLLLAHNPKLAPAAAEAGFDLQLSGHTHAGQFIPWTLVVKVVHKPHAAGLSRSGRMQVYVSAGTGTWGPPIRLGTKPELTLLRLVGVS